MKPADFAMKKVMDEENDHGSFQDTVFLEAARLNNFTQAARNCHIAQTTMTKYITHLERDLGCTLFIGNTAVCHLRQKAAVFTKA